MSDVAGLSAMAEETKGLRPPKPELLGDCPRAAVWPVLTYPRDEKQLKAPTIPVEHFDQDLRDIVGSMATTMYAAGAIGIAAPQVGWDLRIFVADVLSGAPPQQGRPPSQLLVAVNPTLWVLPSLPSRAVEECISFPGARAAIERPSQIVLKAYDLHGEPYALGCGYHLARVIQHEYDHLEGILMLDRLDAKSSRRLKQQMWSGK